MFKTTKYIRSLLEVLSCERHIDAQNARANGSTLYTYRPFGIIRAIIPGVSLGYYTPAGKYITTFISKKYYNVIFMFYFLLYIINYIILYLSSTSLRLFGL